MSWKRALGEPIGEDDYLFVGHLSFANLSGAKLNNAKLNGASLFGTILASADLSNAIWTDGIKCKQGSIGVCIK